MKKGFAVIIVTVMMIFFAGCNAPEKNEKSSKEIASYDYKYKIDVPLDWEMPDEKGSLCRDASIEAFCNRRNAGLAVIVEERGDDYIGFDNYCTLVARNLNSSYYANISADDFKGTEICGNQAKYVEIEDVSSPLGENHVEHVHMWIYLVIINGYYTQFLAWTPESEAEKNSDEINMIINSFTIYKTKNNE